MRCLVTGAEGFLGANLCKALVSQGHEVTGTSLNRAWMTSFDALEVDCRLEYGDITDAAFVDRVIASSEAEWVFHLAAVSIVRIASASPALAMKTNIMGTVNVLDACKRNNVKRVLIASSDKAYGDQGGLPYTEEMALKPTGAYEVSKACADNIGLFYGATVVRCANLYGEGDLNWSRMIPRSVKLALSGKAPQVYGDAVDDSREWLYVGDAVEAYIMLAEKGTAGAYNVGSGCQASPFEIAEMITKITGCDAPELEDKERGFYEIPTQELDCRKVEYTIGWKAAHYIQSGLVKTIAWYREYLS